MTAESIVIEARRWNVALSDAPAARQNHSTAPLVPAEKVNVPKALIFPGSDQEPTKTDAIARFTVELQARRGLLSFSRGERGEPRLRGRAGTAG